MYYSRSNCFGQINQSVTIFNFASFNSMGWPKLGLQYTDFGKISRLKLEDFKGSDILSKRPQTNGFIKPRNLCGPRVPLKLKHLKRLLNSLNYCIAAKKLSTFLTF